jgi:hypothetical protein
MPSGGSNRATPNFFRLGNQDPETVDWRIGFGNGLVPTALTEPGEIQSTLDFNFVFIADFTYLFTPGSVSRFTASNITFSANFVPSYCGLFSFDTMGTNVYSILVLNPYSTPLVNGQTKTIRFYFSGLAV